MGPLRPAACSRVPPHALAAGCQRGQVQVRSRLSARLTRRAQIPVSRREVRAGGPAPLGRRSPQPGGRSASRRQPRSALGKRALVGTYWSELSSYAVTMSRRPASPPGRRPRSRRPRPEGLRGRSPRRTATTPVASRPRGVARRHSIARSSPRCRRSPRWRRTRRRGGMSDTLVGGLRVGCAISEADRVRWAPPAQPPLMPAASR